MRTDHTTMHVQVIKNISKCIVVKLDEKLHIDLLLLHYFQHKVQ